MQDGQYYTWTTCSEDLLLKGKNFRLGWMLELSTRLKFELSNVGSAGP